MKKLFALEVSESNMAGILPGDEVIVDPNEQPKGNGRDIGVFRINNSSFISKFTRMGHQIILLPENGPFQVIRTQDFEVIGKVIGGSIEMDIKKAPAVTGARNALSLQA